MTEPRIIQNFLGYRAFVVSEAPADITQLDTSLAKLGLGVSYPAVEGGTVRLGEEVLASDQSVLFVDADLNLTVEGLGQERLPRIPVIGLIGVEAPSRLKAKAPSCGWGPRPRCASPSMVVPSIPRCSSASTPSGSAAPWPSTSRSMSAAGQAAAT